MFITSIVIWQKIYIIVTSETLIRIMICVSMQRVLKHTIKWNV